MKPPVPASGTAEYLWWSQGAADNQAANDEGLSCELRGMRDCLRHLRGGPADRAAALARIYCADLPLRRRLGLAWRLARG